MSTPLIHSRMVSVMRDVGSVGKDSTNSGQNYSYRGIDALLNAAHVALVKNGVYLTAECLKHNVEIKEVIRANGKPGLEKHATVLMKYTFTAEDGSSVSSIIPGEAQDSSDKASNKSLSASMKYALIQTLAIPTLDMDDSDATSPTMDSPISSTSSSGTVATTSPIDATKRVASFRKLTAPTPVLAKAASDEMDI